MKFLLVLGIAVGLLGRLLAGEQATAVATVAAGFVTGITVTAGGAGYANEPAVTISGGGGSGATAKAILSSDQVSIVIVLTAGSRYTSAPTITIEPPLNRDLSIRMVPAVTVYGQPGSVRSLEWSLSVDGPWSSLTNVLVGTNGSTIVDFSPQSMTRFYRIFERLTNIGPAGFVYITPGTFLMGTADPGYPDSKQHSVTLTRGYWISDHETTSGEWYSVMQRYVGNSADNFPVEVTWYDARLYCATLTKMERAAGRIAINKEFRLPTEAEWEYACRAGDSSNDFRRPIDDIAWYYSNAGRSIHPVKGKQPNQWGIYDMIGNEFEMCLDRYSLFSTNSVTDPKGSNLGSERVAKGGNVNSENDTANPFFRGHFRPDGGSGFRPVLADVTDRLKPLITLSAHVENGILDSLLGRDRFKVGYKSVLSFDVACQSYEGGYISSVEVLMDGEIVGTSNALDITSVSLVSKNKTEGSHTAVAKVVDDLGVVSSSEIYPFDVESFAQPKAISQPKGVTVKTSEFGVVKLSFGVQSEYPLGASYSWYHNGGGFTHDQPNYQGVNASTLILGASYHPFEHLDLSQAGEYYCIYGDITGSVKSDTVIVVVQP